MLWQIVSEIGSFIFTTRVLFFVLGGLIGGMLTVGNAFVYESMGVMLGWWQALVGMVLG